MLSVENIDLYYGAAQALRGVSLEAVPGEITCVLGRNGVGKTSLLRAIAGLCPIDAGTIEVDGRIWDDPAHQRFVPPRDRHVGVVFQDYALFAGMTALDNVAFGLRARGTSRDRWRAGRAAPARCCPQYGQR